VQGIASAVLVLAKSAKKIKLAVNLRSTTKRILEWDEQIGQLTKPPFVVFYRLAT
jgi:hypothetical protein